ncbi:MAG: hypothetical protein M0Z58_02465 [Nitrospiraceae bacterium]|nr:hypothetical protein [Nitrospiraceae bacterium]
MVELRDIVFGIQGLFSKLIGLAGLLAEGVLRSNPALPDEADLILSGVRRLAGDLCRELAASAAEEPAAFKYISIPGHMERICDHFEDLNGLLRMKALQNVHFSDKASDEIHCLFGRLADMFSSASGMLPGDGSGAGGDAIIAGHVNDAWLSVLKSAGDFAALHDERLREGICLPKAHSLYLDMIEDIKAIAWHLNGITREAGG